MKTEFTAAMTQLSAERNLPKEVILAALEAALASAYKKGAPSPDQDILVKIDPDDGKIRAYVQKVVVDSVTNPYREISLGEARNLRGTIQVGDLIELEFVPKDAGRITAQTTRQVVLQRLREAEHHTIYEEFTGKEGEIVTGVVQFIDPKQVYIRLNRTEAILPLSEQIHDERYYRGQRLKLYLLQIIRSDKGPQIIVSRSHPSLLRRLFELEIPEVHSGVVELKAIAREAGYRSKVAVSTNQEGVEPVGSCLGPRGVRLQGIISELNGEKIDIIQWHTDPVVFIPNALSPAQVASIKINEAEKVATVVVPDKQLSLAIGKEGQNARLAARLTGWRIDIKSVSASEAQRVAAQEVAPIVETLEEEPIPSESAPPEPATLEPATPEPVSEPIEPLAIFELEAPPEKPEQRAQIRFAEDILRGRPDIGKRGKEKAKNLEKDKVKGKPHKKRTLPSEDDAYEE